MSVELTHPSPHHNARPKGSVIRCVVLHADAGQSDAGTLAWCADPESKVSYHILIGRNGRVYTLVHESRRAWHAGKGSWGGSNDVNSISVGVAFANKHDNVEPLTPLQLAVAPEVVKALRERHPTIEAVVTHADVSPGRKTDPLHSPGFVRADYQV